jgi:hypothetical protein
MKARVLFTVLGLAGTGFACSSADKYVMPGADGINRVNIRKAERSDAESAAIKIAKKYCKKRDKEAVFINPNVKTEYTGSMNEEDRTNIRQASKAAEMIGGGIYTPPGLPGVGTAGIVGMQMTGGDDYHSTLEFKCE